MDFVPWNLEAVHGEHGKVDDPNHVFCHENPEFESDHATQLLTSDVELHLLCGFENFLHEKLKIGGYLVETGYGGFVR